MIKSPKTPVQRPNAGRIAGISFALVFTAVLFLSGESPWYANIIGGLFVGMISYGLYDWYERKVGI